MKIRKKPRRTAFSLLELLAVVTILGIIAAIIVPRIGVQANAAKQKAALQLRADLNKALERYMFEEGSQPPDLGTLYTDGYYPNPIPMDPVTNSAFTLNVTTGRLD